MNLTSSARKSTKSSYRPCRGSWANPFNLQHKFQENKWQLIIKYMCFPILHTSMWCNIRCAVATEKMPKYAYSYIWKRKCIQELGPAAKQNKIHFIQHMLIRNLPTSYTNKLKIKKNQNYLWLRVLLVRLNTH